MESCPEERSAHHSERSGQIHRVITWIRRRRTGGAGSHPQGTAGIGRPSILPCTALTIGRRYPQRVDLSDEDQAKLDALTERYDELAAQIDADQEDEGAEAALSAVEQEIAVLQKREEAYRSEDLAMAGAIVTIDHWGKLSVLRGLVRDEDKKKAEATEGKQGGATEEADGASKSTGLTHSAALIEDLTAQKTAALRVELANNPDIALVAVVHAMLLKVQYRTAWGIPGHQSALEISVTHEVLDGSMKRPAENKALEAWGIGNCKCGLHLWRWKMCGGLRQASPSMATSPRVVGRTWTGSLPNFAASPACPRMRASGPWTEWASRRLPLRSLSPLRNTRAPKSARRAGICGP